MGDDATPLATPGIIIRADGEKDTFDTSATQVEVRQMKETVSGILAGYDEYAARLEAVEKMVTGIGRNLGLSIIAIAAVWFTVRALGKRVEELGGTE